MDPIFYTDKPWGFFEQFALNEQCTVKILYINKGGCLSRQYHENRDELWVALDDGLIVELDSKLLKPKKGDHIMILRKTLHRASSQKGGRILELSKGFFDETDLVRVEDKYGRK